MPLWRAAVEGLAPASGLPTLGDWCNLPAIQPCGGGVATRIKDYV